MCLGSVLFHFNNQCLFSESPSLPRLTFSSLAVMEDGLSQWIFSTAVLLLFLPKDGSVDQR